LSRVCKKCNQEVPPGRCKVCQKEYSRLYAKRNPRQDYYKAYQRTEKRKAVAREYYQSDRFKSLYRERVKTDPLFALKCRLRSLLYHSIKGRFSLGTKAAKLLGADFETVQLHLISTAIKNYGKYFPNRKYHIDHIVPCSSASSCDELIPLQNYTNLQYLTPSDNLEKGHKLDWSINS